MSLEPGDEPEDGNPFDLDPEADAGTSDPDGWWGLRNTEPPIAPSEVGHQLDVEAEWYQHMGAGFIKQSGGAGVEAWMHYVMGFALFVLQFTSDGTDGDSGGEHGEAHIDPEPREDGQRGPAPV